MTRPKDPGWLRRLLAALGDVLTRRSPGQPSSDYLHDYEPVYGWTQRQLEWYLTRNPGSRSPYEAAVRRCAGEPSKNGFRTGPACPTEPSP
jgi:hypothetical protein